jgi:hypothetical protein
MGLRQREIAGRVEYKALDRSLDHSEENQTIRADGR